MSGEDTINKSDFFLRDIPNVKIGHISNTSKKNAVKEQMQVLHLNDELQQQIMDTLKFIHGPDFSLKDMAEYKDTKVNLGNKYWLGQSNLVIKGACDFSKREDSTIEADRLKLFALLRLESYGFHPTHCIEALTFCEDNVEDALYVLYNKYFNRCGLNVSDNDFTQIELLEQRIDEKSSLESIYGNIFSEKVQHSVWILTLKLDYLIKIFHNKDTNSTKKPASSNVKKKDKCRNFLSGHCKWGDKCRFSHEVEVIEKDLNAHLNDFEFELEIRFPCNSKYPFEPPLILLKTNAVLPPLMNLHICKKLYEEAKLLAENGIPSVYTITEMLKNEEEIKNYIKTTPIEFIPPNVKLFDDGIPKGPKLKRPTHYKKGMTNKDTQKSLTPDEIREINNKLSEKFKSMEKEQKYLDMLHYRKKLPAWDLRNNILNAVRKSQIVVISGETGCGKSTQIPQYLLDHWLKNYEQNQEHLEIVCTQPRRISAIGVAERVAAERISKVGDVVGYQIRLESKISNYTRLTFCTTGILLRRLQSEPFLPQVTHIVVDEVHERSEQSDFLLLILKEILPFRPDLRVILMSATMNAQLFSDYFGEVPILTIPGRTYPVEQYFLESIFEATGYIIEDGSEYSRKINNAEFNTEELSFLDSSVASAEPNTRTKDESLKFAQVLCRYKNYSMRTCKNIFLMDHEVINNELIETLLMWIVDGHHDHPRQGSILIFLPGIAEITSLYDQLSVHREFGSRNNRYLVLPLHSSLTSEEQSLIFSKPKGVRKIILSTNIAETSVTIDDCVFVIDAGRMREKHFDPNRNMESLETVWVTRANALQRKGRAGRVMPGVCFHLYTSNRYYHQMLSQPVPEIHRIPLEQLILNIKLLQMFENKDAIDVINSLIEPPRKEHIVTAIDRLQDVGALDFDQQLTPLGHHLAELPVDVRIGKLLLYGAIFSCVDAALTMAACLSYKSPFVAPFKKRDEADEKKRKFAAGHSDHITMLMAYKKWLATFKKSRLAGRNFANENFLSHKSLMTIADVKHQFLEFLVDIGFIPVNLDGQRKSTSGEDNVLQLTGSEFNRNGENLNVLGAILCAALYPNVIKILTPPKSYVKSIAGAIPKENEAKEFRFLTAKETVFIHPSSVNFTVKNFPSPYLVYQEKVKTSKVYFRDCSVIPVICLVLFSGYDLDIRVNSGRTFISLESGWIMFQVEEHKIAEMIKMLRKELFMLLEEKIKDPLLNLWHQEKGERVISTILNIINLK